MILLSTLAFLVGLAITYWIHSGYALDIVVRPAAAPPSPAPLISVIVPARNEARNIRRCLEALLVQSYPSYEIVVVDDRSTDETPRILSQLVGEVGRGKLRILQGGELPAGWAGKPHALAQGAAAAQGEWLCFIDADTFAAPELLDAALATAQEQGADLFTIMTSQELGTFWERVILPVVFTALSFGFPARRVNDPSKPDAIANGQFILIRRAAYEAVGGHGAVSGNIDEDRALAALVKRSGFRLVMADGRMVASTRMYTSLAEMWEGWTKNIFLGLRGRLELLLFGALAGLLAALVLPLWLAAGLLWFIVAGGLAPALVAGEAVLLWVYLLWMRGRVYKAMHISAWYAFSLPLGALVFTAMMFASTYKVLSGKGVTWKGRTYSG